MKKPGIAFLCWLLCFVGFCGIHRFYNGKWVTGLIWFFTGGLLLIGQIVDLFLINSMTAQANRRIQSDFRRMQSL